MIAQFREIGIPRCYDCQGLIWPWQAWVEQHDDQPVHHVPCYHDSFTRMGSYYQVVPAYYKACPECGLGFVQKAGESSAA